MSLINCPDCNKEVSSNAPACVGCGAPLANQESKGSGVAQLTTIQETSKKSKAHKLIAIAMILAGIFIFWVGTDLGYPPEISGFVMAAGVAFYMINKISTWWHHA